MVVTYTVVGCCGFLYVWTLSEEPAFWDYSPSPFGNPSDCLWIVPGTID